MPANEIPVMRDENTYDLSNTLAADLGTSVEENSDFNSFLRIRRELNHFLLSINQSSQAEGAGQQIHFLFLALEHLDNVEREIWISGADEEIIQSGKIRDKIRSLKNLILGYIRHLTDEQ